MTKSIKEKTVAKKENIFLKKGFREGLSGFIFIAPFLAGVIIFQLYVFISGFYLSLTDASGLHPAHFIGIANYQQLWNEFFSRGEFWKAALYTFEYEAGCLLTQVPVAFVLAFVLNSLPYKILQGVLRTCFFIPCIINSIIVGWIFSQLFNPEQGTINWVLGLLGLMKENPVTHLLKPIDWVNNTDLVIVTLIIISFWQWMGYHMVYFVSQLQTIDPNLYEAAKIDGATNAQIITRITLPLMRPAVSFVTITSLVGGFLLFDLIFIVYGGAGVGMFGPGNHAKLFVPYIYYYAFDKSPTQIGLASAAGWMVFFLIAIINIIQIRVLGLGSAKEE